MRSRPDKPEADPSGHISVLAEEALEGLQVRPDGTYLDATAGGGGHSLRIAQALDPDRGCLIAVDRDPVAVERARVRLAPYACARVIHRNYRELNGIMEEAGIHRVDGVLFDFGLSSFALDDPLRGFSFEQEGPLDMRMDPGDRFSAREYLSSVAEEELARVLTAFGDVRPARRIAAAIVRRARKGEMSTTRDLAGAVSEALPFVRGVPEETRTVFQAVRMAVNDELSGVEAGVRQAIEALNPGGRLVCISFHSGEDRIVKNLFRQGARPEPERSADGRILRRIAPVLRLLTPGPVRPSEAEVLVNPRAHSARMRIAERLETAGGVS